MSRFKLLKDTGALSQVQLIDKETNCQTTIGVRMHIIYDVLERHGYTTPSSITDTLDLEIDKDTAKDLISLVFTITAPNRIKRKPTVSDKQVDAMDVLLGLAHY